MAYSFINNINSFANLQIFEELKPEDPEEAETGLIIATLNDSEEIPRPDGVKKILNRDKPKLFKKYLLESSTLIYDLNTGDLDEIEAAVRMLKAEPFEEPKTLIVISSV
jgi:adenylate kinase